MFDGINKIGTNLNNHVKTKSCMTTRRVLMCRAEKIEKLKTY